MIPPPGALESLVASPECEPGLEVPIDCEEDDLPHLPGWVRKSMVKYVSPTGLWMDTPTRSVATEWEVRLKKKYLYPRVERESWPSARGGESVSTRKRIYTMSVSWVARAALLGDWGYRPRYLRVAGTLQPMRLYSTVCC